MSLVDAVASPPKVWGGSRLAIVGCTGLVGTTVLKSLVGRADMWDDVVLLDVAGRAGQIIPVRQEYRKVHPLTLEALDEVDIAVCALPPEQALEWVPAAAQHGTRVVDCSGVFRDDPQIPLVSAEVNAAEVAESAATIVSSPGSLALAATVALAPLHAQYVLSDVAVTALTPASASGRRGIERLLTETAAVSGSRDLGFRAGDVRAKIMGTLDQEASPFAAPLALNVVPWVGDGGGTDSSLEEAFCSETRRLLQAPEVRVSATCVQVPVLVGETCVFVVRCEKPAPVDAVRALLVNAPGVVVLDDADHGEVPTPIDVVGSDPAFAGRVRQLPDTPRGVSFVMCSDNLRLGSALNAVRIAEEMARVAA